MRGSTPTAFVHAARKSVAVHRECRIAAIGSRFGGRLACFLPLPARGGIRSSACGPAGTAPRNRAHPQTCSVRLHTCTSVTRDPNISAARFTKPAIAAQGEENSTGNRIFSITGCSPESQCEQIATQKELVTSPQPNSLARTPYFQVSRPESLFAHGQYLSILGHHNLNSKRPRSTV